MSNHFGILFLVVFSFIALLAQGSDDVKENLDELTKTAPPQTVEENNGENLSQEEMIEAGLLKYAGVFGGPSDDTDTDESGRGKRVKRQHLASKSSDMNNKNI